MILDSLIDVSQDFSGLRERIKLTHEGGQRDHDKPLPFEVNSFAIILDAELLLKVVLQLDQGVKIDGKVLLDVHTFGIFLNIWLRDG